VGGVVVGEDDPLVGGIESDPELAAGLCKEPTGTESSDLSWKIDCRSLRRSAPDPSLWFGVSITGEAVFVSVSVEGVSIRRPTGRTRDVPNKLGVLFIVVHRSHSDKLQAVEDR
jgi:hypothetical protein